MENNSSTPTNQNSQIRSTITANRLLVDQVYIDEAGGILNALVKASALYIYKVIEREAGQENIQRFDQEKIKKLHRIIIHKNAHLDEYFAELLFRAILPPHMKDLEIKEHILISKSNDIFAKITWPNAVVFGIGREDAGGANALQVFDEHNAFDGSRIKPSCSQLVADEFLRRIPKSIQIVLNEVNTSDSQSGAHQYNLKNLITPMHDVLFTVGYDQYNKTEIKKYLTENWKRALIDACIVAMIYAYQNGIYTDGRLDDQLKYNIERTTETSLKYFVEHSLLAKNDSFEELKKSMLFYQYKAGNHDSIDRAIWYDKDGKEIGKQIFIISKVCYALEQCWGKNIGSFVMMHLWQGIFHQQILFKEIVNDIKNLPNDQLIKTGFGSVRKIQIDNPGFQPEQRAGDRRTRKLQVNCPLWLFEINLAVPDYFNTAAAFKFLINNEYAQKGNNGFGIILLHDKTLNSKVVNTGMTVPSRFWNKISNAIVAAEPDRWFQLKRGDENADFVLNRTKSHQEFLPSTEIDIEFIKNVIEKI